MKTGNLYSGMASALGLLAGSPDQQRFFLNDLGVAPLCDELALEFEDELLPIKHRVCGELLGVLEELDALLDSMGGEENRSLWQTDALDCSAEWEHVRELAQKALSLIPDIAPSRNQE